LDDHVLGTARKDHMFDLVAAHEDQLAASVELNRFQHHHAAAAALYELVRGTEEQFQHPQAQNNEDENQRQGDYGGKNRAIAATEQGRQKLHAASGRES